MNFFSDIIALAKAGYSVSDVKELMALGKDSETVPPKEDKPGTDDNGEVKDNKPVEEPTKTEPEPAIDYKALFEESQKQLKEAQKANIDKPVEKQNKTTVDDILKDLL